MKRGATLVFDGGNLQIKLRGFEGQDGWGTFTFDDEQIERVPLEESQGCVGKVDIPPSELRELRDFLNKYLPDTAATSAMDGSIVLRNSHAGVHD